MADSPLIEPLLICPICLDQFKEPKILPCHHSFCMRCLAHTPFDKKQDTHQLSCPTCRALSQLPAEGVEGLPPSFLINSMLERLKNIEVSDHTPITTQHKALSCPDHDNKPMDMYCTNCDKMICQLCVTRQHRGHECDLAIDVYDECMNPVFRLMADIEGHVKHIQVVGQRLQAAQKEKTEQSVKMKQLVTKKTDELINIIHQSRDKLIKEIDDNLKTISGNIEKRNEALDRASKRLHTPVATMRQVINEKSKLAVLGQRDEMISELKSLDTDYDDKIVTHAGEFTPDIVANMATQLQTACKSLEREYDKQVETFTARKRNHLVVANTGLNRKLKKENDSYLDALLVRPHQPSSTPSTTCATEPVLQKRAIRLKDAMKCNGPAQIVHKKDKKPYTSPIIAFPQNHGKTGNHHTSPLYGRKTSSYHTSPLYGSKEEKRCPVCDAEFLDLMPQDEFERHVNSHFM